MKTKIQIIPLPDYLKEEEGQYLFEGNRGVCINMAPPDLKGKMEKAFSLATIKTSEKGIPLSIEIKKETDQKQSDSAYTLKVSEKGITISAATDTPLSRFATGLSTMYWRATFMAVSVPPSLFQQQKTQKLRQELAPFHFLPLLMRLPINGEVFF